MEKPKLRVVVVMGCWAFNRVRFIRETMSSVGCVLPTLSSPSITDASALTRTTASHSLLHPSSQNLWRRHVIIDFSPDLVVLILKWA